MSRGTTPVSMLFPSGEDANPLNRRLPAEVITRQRRPVKKVVEEKPSEDVVVDLKTALSFKPDNRPKWLTRAFKMAEEGRASTTDLYDIVASRKFASGVPLKVTRRIRELVFENIELFSEKQQRYLKSEECILNAKQVEKGDREGDMAQMDAEKDEDEADMELDLPEEKAPPPVKPTPPPEVKSKTSSNSAAAALSAVFDMGTSSSSAGAAPASQAVQRSATKVAAPPPEELDRPIWSEAPAARGQEERLKRDVLLAEERARKKAQEREDQERWFAAEIEASSKSVQQRQAQKQRLEDEVDSSMMLLERLGQQKQLEKHEEKRSTRDKKSGRKRGLSRSRSISVKRSRSRRRRRKGRSSSPEQPAATREDFSNALARRLAEREKSDTTRIPVVDPGHAQRSWR
mmetsp:Transcript_33311/g.61070  ORF Transcript_33311/g.61070 Transcript_33311/m.61070 type:complete len:403 (+) Transcript_33311:67-1275(+)